MTSAADGPGDRPPRRSRRGPALLGSLGFVVFIVLIGLGTWQVQRLQWKLDLIAKVDARIHAAPVSAPGPADWPAVSRDGDEYRRVTLTGRFDHGKETLVQAVTERGPGFWVLTPLARDDGTIILVNRGFVPQGRRDPASRAAGEVPGEATVTGLLRITEPGGAFLRDNDPAGDRWYSRDVEAIAAAHGLDEVAPYFVDADGTPNPGGLPAGGLTVVSFRNHHLVYALTWYALAAMLAGVGFWAVRDARHRRLARPESPSRATLAGETQVR